MKNIEDYLHLYIGTNCQFKTRNTGSMFTRRLEGADIGHLFDEEYFTFIKPCLRPLSDMNDEEEAEYLKKIPATGYIAGEARRVHYLLKQGFDLFGLIENGLAIDTTKL